jgi:hypothetical protein
VVRAHPTSLWMTLLWCAGAAAVAKAHSAPAVFAIVDEDESGARVLQLSEGLAEHTAGHWRYVCAARWRGDVADPAGSLPSFGVAIGASSGLWLMARDGSISPHPDPAAEGHVTAFARSSTSLFALRESADICDVLEVFPDRVRVVRSEPRCYADIAATDAALHLVRIGQDEVETVSLSREGEVIAEARAPLADILRVEMRPLRDVPYLVATFQGSMLQLGRIDGATWLPIQTASGNLGGPIELVSGTRFIAIEGKLATFDAGMTMPRPDIDFVTRLRRHGVRAYATTVSAVRDLDEQGLGATIFDLAQLEPPSLSDVDPELRSACNLEWQHFRFELLASNIPITDPAPTPAAAAGAPAASASQEAPALQPLPKAPSSPTASPGPSGGCRVGLARRPLRAGNHLALGLLLAPLAWLALRLGIRPRHSRRVRAAK